jgi:hypothetical protein
VGVGAWATDILHVAVCSSFSVISVLGVVFSSFAGVSLLPLLLRRRLRQTGGIVGALPTAAVGASTGVQRPLGAAMRRQNLADNEHN